MQMFFIQYARKSQKRKNFCCDCGAKIGLQASRCVKCNALFRRIEKPVSREELKKLIRTLPFTQIGQMFGISDNAIKKWCDSYNLPRKKTDIKSFQMMIGLWFKGGQNSHQ